MSTSEDTGKYHVENQQSVQGQVNGDHNIVLNYYSHENSVPLSATRGGHTDWNSYKKAVFEEHQWVRLAVIAGTRQDSLMRIPLTEVFVSQMSKTGLPNYDISDEILASKRHLFGLDKLLETSSPEVGTEAIGEDLGVLGETSPELVLDVLARERTQVFLGGPGSGKSTLLHYMLLVLCHSEPSKAVFLPHLQNSPIPFLIELRQYSLKGMQDFIEYIVENTKKRYGVPIDAEDLRSLFREHGRALVAFDGLDEIFDPSDRASVMQSCRVFARQYRTHIIVTSRIVGYEENELGVEQFQHYTLLDLNPRQISQFVTERYQQYIRKAEEHNTQGLMQSIIKNPRLMELASNPLLLTMMAMLYKHGDLPEQRWKLYERCTTVLLEDWEIKRKHIEHKASLRLEINIRAPQKAEILQHISIHMLEHRQKGQELNAITSQSLMEILAKYLKKEYKRSKGEAEAIAQDILQHLRERTYILAQVSEGIFGFVHRTFMEYFAAYHCQTKFIRKSDYHWLTVEIFGKHWQQEHWQEVLLLLIAMLSDQKNLIREIVDYLRTKCRKEIPVNVAFAARCLAETGKVVDQQWTQSLLTELVQEISNHASQARQENVAAFLDTALSALFMLAPIAGVPRDVKEYVKRLQESKAESVRVRMVVWQMDLALRSQQERLDLAVAALQDKEEAIRRGAVAALEREWPGNDEVGQVLIKTVRTDQRPAVRQAALGALQRAWPEREDILDAIESRIEKKSAYTYIAWLIQYLSVNWRGHLRAVGIVTELAVQIKVALAQKLPYKSRIREAAIKAIGQAWSGDPKILTLLKDWTADTNPSVRRTAVGALVQGWWKDAEILTLLKYWAVKDADSCVRGIAVEALVRSWQEDVEALVLLREIATKDTDPTVRLAVVEALVRNWQEDAEVLALLREIATKDTDPTVCLAVVEALVRNWQEDAEVLALLREIATKDTDPTVHRIVIRVLVENWRDAETLPLLKGLVVKDINSAVRQAIVEELGRGWWGDVEVLALVREIATKDANPAVRRVAVKEIGWNWRGDAECLALLEKLVVEDTDPGVRKVAIQAVVQGWRGDTEALALVRKLAIKDINLGVRKVAIQAIMKGWWGDAEALALVRKLAAKDTYPPVVRQRASFLMKFC